MAQEIDLFKEMLVKRGYPDTLIPVELAWVIKQPLGTAKYILECVNRVEAFLAIKRGQEDATHSVIKN